jgi:hypothetical protein
MYILVPIVVNHCHWPTLNHALIAVGIPRQQHYGLPTSTIMYAAAAACAAAARRRGGAAAAMQRGGAPPCSRATGTCLARTTAPLAAPARTSAPHPLNRTLLPRL